MGNKIIGGAIILGALYYLTQGSSNNTGGSGGANGAAYQQYLANQQAAANAAAQQQNNGSNGTLDTILTNIAPITDSVTNLTEVILDHQDQNNTEDAEGVDFYNYFEETWPEAFSS
ncbi:MAG: hypothetical protein ACPG5B_06760 [Chitinophagales bacterium]